jgi:hypothetical protein
MMEAWEVAARESIRDLVARYNASGDAGRFDETLALFAADASLTVLPSRHYEGHREIRSLFTEAARTTRAPEPSARLIRHFTATHQIDLVSPSEGTGRCYYAVLTDVGLDHWGRYVDRYVYRDERWLFAQREISVDRAIPGGWGERAAKGEAS